MSKKIIKLLLVIIAIFSIGNCYVQDVSTSNSKKALITNVNKITSNSYVALTKEVEKKEVDDSNNEIRNEDNNKKSDTNDFTVPKKEKQMIIDNSITIPNVCTNARLSIGSTQEAVDRYDICIMTEVAASFGQGKPILIGGHNTKSLKYLYKSCVDDIITIYYENSYYKYKIIYSNECTNDGQKLYDIDTSINMLDYNLDQEILYIYTCYSNNNWLVKAVKI
ncbi:sortase domain-containing protein [Thomasclavelia cocleata]|jgi:antitoxin component YwqK of YwqJK toxin-antitoxin module|uniref:sortase domain-containing protein n=1 Tax=Thomasclavelia cocleata TaxID=69824 RepID=UPI002430F25C|nr:sortase [Thomasclavelia cocleata]MCI9630119.1 sortase [Thomasclavelia cocleata]